MSESRSTNSSFMGFPNESTIDTPPREGEFSSNESSSGENQAIARELGVSSFDQIYTERIQIDGRRLQRMLESEGDVKGSNRAEIFFENVMKKTETYISWPKKLSEDLNQANDPYVHVYGKQEDISWAKGLILNSLDTRDKHLKLRIIIPNNDHRFIVGRDNNNLIRIMDSTGTIVELPYSNQRNMAQKGNQVTIEGGLDGIEKARIQLRSSMPLLMSFEYPPNHPEPCINEVKEKYNIQVILTKQSKHNLVFVKGSLKRIDIVKAAIRQLINSIFNKYVPKPLVSVQLEIPPLYQDFVKGEDNVNLLQIMEESKTKIFFPDLSISGNPKERSQVTVIGTIEGVCKAREDLVSSFPIELMFDIPGQYQNNATDILNIGTHFGLCITLAQKDQDCALTVTIKGVENSIQKIYEVYQDIISLRSALPDLGEVPKAFYLLEGAYQRVMSDLVRKYIENVSQRTNYATAQFHGITNYGADPSYGYIQAAQTNYMLEQYSSPQMEQYPSQGPATYTPDSGNHSDTVYQVDNQPKDWTLFAPDGLDGFAGLAIADTENKSEENLSTDCGAQNAEPFDQQLPSDNLDPTTSSALNYGAVYAGSAAPGAERHILAELKNNYLFPQPNYLY